MSKKFKSIEYKHKAVMWQKCPVKCLSYDNENVEYLGLPAIKNDIEKCIACKTCENICPDCAIRVDGKKK
jgi:2-oxoglutarate ferredoxin oxidoreductase subunit delta